MSIRLRLTLLFSAILAITLIGFSASLYVTQSQLTMGNIKAGLEQQAQGLAGRQLRPPPGDSGPAPFPGSNLPGRWSQVRNLDGTIQARTPDLSITELPLSDAGLQAVKGGAAWTETSQVDSEPLLIYSQPVIRNGQVISIVQVAAPISEREQSLATLRWILIIGTIFAVLLAFGGGWLMAGTALEPIERITHTAQAIGASRDFGRRVDHQGPNDEVGQLAVTFNGMLSELESSYRQVQKSLDAQRRFVADASHELRTPLTTIRGNIELLRHEQADPEERCEILTDTQAEAERMMRLVSQLLVLARADAGRPLNRERLAVNPLVGDACRQARGLNPARTIECNLGPDALVTGDRDALKQVLIILLDNAMRHTPPAAAITVSTRVSERVQISVADTGPGIAPDLLPHIFKRFYQAEASRTGPGAGLGLSIAQELVRAQQGELAVESTVGQGSTFTISLPKVAES